MVLWFKLDYRLTRSEENSTFKSIKTLIKKFSQEWKIQISIWKFEANLGFHQIFISNVSLWSAFSHWNETIEMCKMKKFRFRTENSNFHFNDEKSNRICLLKIPRKILDWFIFDSLMIHVSQERKIRIYVSYIYIFIFIRFFGIYKICYEMVLV